MKIVFMGTPDFSVPTLQALIESKHQVVACYTQPDKQKGRGKKITFSAVKAVCLEHQIPVYQPERIRRPQAVEEFQAMDCDVCVVIAYGQILPDSILNRPRYGCINIHASLLPELRGAAPYQWAILNGDRQTGLTTMQMDKGMDTGDILLQTKISIPADQTAGELHDRLMLLGGDLILQTLDLVETGQLQPIPQNEEKATYAPMLKKSIGNIDWTKSAVEIERFIRGLNPWPSAYTYLDQTMVKLWQAQVIEYTGPAVASGTIYCVDSKRGLAVKCQDQALLITQLQPQGKRPMSAADYIRGLKSPIEGKQLKSRPS